MLTHEQAARRLGMKTREVTRVQSIGGVGDVVTTHDGMRTVIHDEGGLTFLRREDALPNPHDNVSAEATEADAGGPSKPIDPVPAGTADQVLAWVGDNPARADAALRVEQASGRPRSTLVATLEKLAG